ncbi:MAG: type VI secretion system tube protein TssD [Verrucomicrobiota bacterium]
MKTIIASILVALATTFTTSAAETVHLFLTANGNDIEGESTQVSLGRANSIEAFAFQSEFFSPTDAGSGRPTGRRTYKPITFTKRIDKSSPLLAKAFVNNETIAGEIRFYRTDSNSGMIEHYYTIELQNARVARVRNWTPSTIDPASVSSPDLEEVSLTFETITWTDEESGNSTTDSTSDS